MASKTHASDAGNPALNGGCRPGSLILNAFISQFGICSRAHDAGATGRAWPSNVPAEAVERRSDSSGSGAVGLTLRSRRVGTRLSYQLPKDQAAPGTCSSRDIGSESQMVRLEPCLVDGAQYRTRPSRRMKRLSLFLQDPPSSMCVLLLWLMTLRTLVFLWVRGFFSLPVFPCCPPFPVRRLPRSGFPCDAHF